MRRSFVTALMLFITTLSSLGAQSFFVDSNPFTLKNDPIRVGMDEFERKLDAIRAEREPIGLVLSGGSARAFAHIGVLAAMEAVGVRPDYIVANSMGAIVALLYAAGYSPADIERLVAGTDLASMFEPVIPLRGGLLDARKFEAAMRTLLGGDRDLADLPIPIIIVTEDLKTRRPVHIASGDFAQVLTASFALPAFFEPVDMGELRLSDGGVTNLVPVAAAAAYSSKVIAATALYDRDLNLSNPLVVLGRAIDIGKTRQAITEMEKFRPVVIRCEVEDVSFMDFDKAEMLVRRGKSSAERSMDEVLAMVGDDRPQALAPLMRAQRTAEVSSFIKSRERMAVDLRPTPEFSVKPELRLFDEMEGGSPFLEDERFIGAGAHLAFGRTDVSLGGLYRFDSGFENPFALSAGLKTAPFNAGVLSSRFYLSGDPAEADYELTGDADFVSVLSALPLPRFVPRLIADGAFRMTDDASAGTDAAGRDAADSTAWYVEGGIGFHPRGDATGAQHRFAVMGELDTLWRIDDLENSGPAWKAKLRAGFPGFLEARGRFTGRWALEGPGTRILENDGYRGALDDEEEVGRAAPVVAVSNFELAVGSGDTSLSFAELALFRAVQLAAYFDTAYTGEGFDELRSSSTGGLSLSADLSFLGLAPIGFSAFGGVSLDGESWVAGFRIGRFFN